MRIIRDASKKLGVDPKDLFTMACAMHEGENAEDLWKYYQKTNSIPCWLTDWLIDTLTKGGNLGSHCGSGNHSAVPVPCVVEKREDSQKAA